MKTGLWGLLIASGVFNCLLGVLDRPLKTLDRSPKILDPLLEALDRGAHNFKNDAKAASGIRQNIYEKNSFGSPFRHIGRSPSQKFSVRSFARCGPAHGHPWAQEKNPI